MMCTARVYLNLRYYARLIVIGSAYAKMIGVSEKSVEASRELAKGYASALS